MARVGVDGRMDKRIIAAMHMVRVIMIWMDKGRPNGIMEYISGIEKPRTVPRSTRSQG